MIARFEFVNDNVLGVLRAVTRSSEGRKTHLRWLRGNSMNKCDRSTIAMRQEITRLSLNSTYS